MIVAALSFGCGGKNISDHEAGDQPLVAPLAAVFEEGRWDLWATGGAQRCGVSDSALACHGQFGSFELELLEAPTLMAVSDHLVCASSSEGTECWWIDADGQRRLDSIEQPEVTDLQAHAETVCTLSTTGRAECFEYEDAEFVGSTLLSETGALAVRLAACGACTRMPEGWTCPRSPFCASIPTGSPPDADFGSTLACWSAAGGVACTDASNNGLEHLTLEGDYSQVHVGGTFVCAVSNHDAGVDCWSREEGLSTLAEPTKTLSSTNRAACALLQDGRAACWSMDPRWR